MTFQTIVKWNRVLDDQEKKFIRQFIDEALIISSTNGMLNATSLERLVRTWDTLEYANKYLELLNSFNPPPEAVEITS